jgi:hypothetical protein
MRRLGFLAFSILLLALLSVLPLKERRASAAQMLYTIGYAMDAYTMEGTFVQHHYLPREVYRATTAPDGNFFVSYLYGSDISRVNSTTGASLGAFIAAGSGGLTSPTAMTVGPDNNLYVGQNSAILRFDGTTGAFLNSYTSAINYPARLNFGGDGLLYVADALASKILRFPSLDAGAVPEVLASVYHPTGLAMAPDGSLYVAAGSAIYKLTPGTPAWSSQLFIDRPGLTFNTVYVDNLGAVYVGMTGLDGMVYEFNASGQLLNQFAGIQHLQDIIWPVPEPASASVLAFSLIVLLRRRSRTTQISHALVISPQPC